MKKSCEDPLQNRSLPLLGNRLDNFLLLMLLHVQGFAADTFGETSSSASGAINLQSQSPITT